MQSELVVRMPHRETPPVITVRSGEGVYTDLEPGEIRKIHGEEKIYYEGLDHSEAFIALKDFLLETGVDP